MTAIRDLVITKSKPRRTESNGQYRIYVNNSDVTKRVVNAFNILRINKEGSLSIDNGVACCMAKRGALMGLVSKAGNVCGDDRVTWSSDRDVGYDAR